MDALNASYSQLQPMSSAIRRPLATVAPSRPHRGSGRERKNALLAAAYHIKYLNGENRLPLFIATGGAGGLAATLKHLKGRKVVLFPDEDQMIEWSKIASKNRSLFRSITIDTTTRQYVIDGLLPPKSDYGDLLELIHNAECLFNAECGVRN